MNTQLIICLVIFVATLVSFLLNKIPMWLTSMISLAALFITNCIDANGALSGFANTNTILMAAMFVVAAGFRRTTLVDTMCSGILRLTKGSFKMAFLGYLILTAVLANFIASPMVVYAIVSPLVCALCDKGNVSRSLYIFPLMVTAIATCGILPGPTAIQMSGQFTGFMETYGFTGMTFSPTNFFIGEWPVIIVVIAWAMLLSGKFLPASTETETAEKKQNGAKASALSPLANTAGIVIFFVTIVVLVFAAQLKLQTWWVAIVGSLMMVLFGVVDQKNALRDIPWDMILLYVGALALGTALTNTGAGEMIGNALAGMVGGTHNNYILGALFFVIPFLMTQVMLNRAVSAVFVPICLLTCSALGANPVGLIMLVNAGSLTAFMTPMATPAVPMAMGDGGYELKDLLKGGWLISVILSVVYIFYTMTVFPAF